MRKKGCKKSIEKKEKNIRLWPFFSQVLFANLLNIFARFFQSSYVNITVPDQNQSCLLLMFLFRNITLEIVFLLNLFCELIVFVSVLYD